MEILDTLNKEIEAFRITNSRLEHCTFCHEY